MKENKLADALASTPNRGVTEKGAPTLVESMNPCVDLFFRIGAARSKREDLIYLFDRAFDVEPLTALKIVFYARDVRGGMGERDTFRYLLRYIGDNYSPALMLPNTHHIPFYGRWDDMLPLLDSKCPVLVNQVSELLKNQAEMDTDADEPSLLGKWLPSINSGSKDKTKRRQSKNTRRWAMKLSKAWFGKRGHGLYRKLCSKLRKALNLLATKMTEKRYEDVEYGKLGSQEGLKYTKAFKRNDETRYEAYREALSKGEEKVNASTLFPHDVIYQIFTGAKDNETTWGDCSLGHISDSDAKYLDEVWKALPDYDIGNTLVLSDTSGSMESWDWSGDSKPGAQPIHISLALALYLSQRMKGPFKDTFIIFSSRPTITRLTGDSIVSRLREAYQSVVSDSTNLAAALELVLDLAVKNDVSQEDMPEQLVIVSDMEFDPYKINGGRFNEDDTNYEAVKQRFAEAGYILPAMVWWNVCGRNANYPMEANDHGALVSGFSPSIVKAMHGPIEDRTPEVIVRNAISDERYNRIVVPSPARRIVHNL